MEDSRRREIGIMEGVGYDRRCDECNDELDAGGLNGA
jgi:hypothetical protein